MEKVLEVKVFPSSIQRFLPPTTYNLISEKARFSLLSVLTAQVRQLRYV